MGIPRSRRIKKNWKGVERKINGKRKRRNRVQGVPRPRQKPRQGKVREGKGKRKRGAVYRGYHARGGNKTKEGKERNKNKGAGEHGTGVLRSRHKKNR